MEIRTALSMLDTSSITGAVHLQYVRSDGTIGEIQKALKGSKNVHNREKSNFKYRVKQAKVALVYDGIKHQYRSIKIWRIIGCNGQKVTHKWQ